MQRLLVACCCCCALMGSLIFAPAALAAEDNTCSATSSCTAHAAAAAAASSNPHAWTNAFFATLLISVFGNVGIVLYMFIDSGKSGEGNNNSNALNTMVAFAVGGLLGDVFLHLLPHASAPHLHHDHHHDHAHDGNSGGIWVLIGIFSFFLFERIVRAYHHHGGGSHSHSHSHTPSSVENKEEIRPGAWLNLFADVQHNFVDGMAIAAAFQVSNVVGMSTMLGVLIHEIPHEMGDFAVLLNQGFSKRGALLCQFVSSLGAFTGCAFGLIMGSSGSAEGQFGSSNNNASMLNFTAGGFIYVALVDVLPELLKEQASLAQTVREFLAIFAGVGIMIWVGTFEASSSHAH